MTNEFDVEYCPLTEEEHRAADEDHRRRAENQKEYLREIAELLDEGEPLDTMQRKFAAEVLRHVAKHHMPTERPRPNRRPRKVPGDAAFLVAFLVLRGVEKTKAIEDVMTRYDIYEPSTFKKALVQQKYDEVLESCRAMMGGEPKK